MNLTKRFAYDPDDSAELRAEKFATFLVALSCCLAGGVWSAMYFVVFGAGLIHYCCPCSSWSLSGPC